MIRRLQRWWVRWQLRRDPNHLRMLLKPGIDDWMLKSDGNAAIVRDRMFNTLAGTRWDTPMARRLVVQMAEEASDWWRAHADRA